MEPELKEPEWTWRNLNISQLSWDVYEVDDITRCSESDSGSTTLFKRVWKLAASCCCYLSSLSASHHIIIIVWGWKARAIVQQALNCDWFFSFHLLL